MTEETKGLPVQGYKPTQPQQWALDLVNENKILEERVLRQIDRHASTEFPFVDKRHVAIARTEIEKAFMSLNRAVFQPQRIALPEDDTGYKMTAYGRREDGSIGPMKEPE